MPFAKHNGAAAVYRTAAHRKARAALIAHFTPGDPCCLCGHPMWPLPDGKTSNLHADHCPACAGQGCASCNGTGYRGLAHGDRCTICKKRCNQSDGAARGRRRQDTKQTRLKW